jgi:hypothetical protein
MLDALAVGLAGERPPRGQAQEADGGLRPAAGHVVQRDRRRRLGLGAEGGLQPRRHPAVQLGAAGRGERLEQHVAVHGVGERVTAGGRAVRPPRGADGADDRRGRDPLHRPAERGCDRGVRELDAVDRRRLEHLQGALVQGGHAGVQRRPQRLGDALQVARLPHVGDEMLHEQRIACATLHEPGRRSGVQAERRGGDGGIEPAERDFAGRPAQPQLADERIRPVTGGHDQQARRMAAAHDGADQVARRGIRPLQVLEHEDDGPAGGQRLERLDELAHHALAGHAVRALLGRLRAQPRQVGEPARRAGGQHAGHLGLGLRGPAEAVEQRQERLSRPAQGDALARDHERLTRAGEQGLDQRALADPRLAGDEHEPAGALRRRVERRPQGGELLVAAGGRRESGTGG